MVRIHLPDGELHRLQDAFRTADDRRLRDRIQIILMAHRGRPHGQIPTDLGISRRTIPRWLNAYVERGLRGLRPGKAEGATPKIPADLTDEIKTWVVEGPAKQGFVCCN